MTPATLDWVEQETGEAGGSICDRDGHHKVVVGGLKEVHGHLAAHMECTVCGLKGFHWIPEEGGQ